MKQKIQATILTFLLFLVFLPLASATLIVKVNISSNGMVKYPSPGLRVDGKRIVDEFGRQVLLRGFSLWDSDIFYAQNIELTVERLKVIKDWGFNVVRTEAWWGTHIERYYAQPGVYDEENLMKLENVIKNAGQAGLYVVITMRIQHQYPTLEWEMFRDNPNLPTAEWLLTAEGLTRFCKMWEMLVQRFDNYPQVIGYNPWHFPFHIFGQPLDEQRKLFPIWREGYYETFTPAVVNAIRRHSNKIIFYSPFRHGFYEALYEPWVDIETGEFNFCPPLADKNVVYMHEGHAPRDVEWETAWNYNMDYLRSQYQPAFDFSNKYNVPMCMAEFGLENPPFQQSRLDCLDAKLQLLDEQGDYNWLYWIYSIPNVLNPDLTPTAAVPVLQAHSP